MFRFARNAILSSPISSVSDITAPKIMRLRTSTVTAISASKSIDTMSGIVNFASITVAFIPDSKTYSDAGIIAV